MEFECAGGCVTTRYAKRGMRVPRILVADDNSNIQKMVALAFEEQGIDVVGVGNGEAAVRRIPDLNPDIVLADVFMPVRTGYEVCEFVKKDPRFAKVPVILLVGAFDPLDENEAKRVGADGVLKKPFVPPDPLIAMVTEALGKLPKPEAPKFEAPVVEMPRPAPPPVIEEFPEPAEGEEVYAFGTGRRSLEDEEEALAGAKNENAGFAKAPAATRDAEAEEETETRAGWKRRVEVDFDEVPKFAAQLVDELDAPEAAAPSAEVEAPAASGESEVEVAEEESPAIADESHDQPASAEAAIADEHSPADALVSSPTASEPAPWNSEYAPVVANESAADAAPEAVEVASSLPAAAQETETHASGHEESDGESFFAPDPEVFLESVPVQSEFHGDVTDFDSAPPSGKFVTASPSHSATAETAPQSDEPLSLGSVETTETPEPAAKPETNAARTANVDDVVAKVLEKLGPQLQELLAKGVRPVVEDLIQNPDGKKK